MSKKDKSMKAAVEAAEAAQMSREDATQEMIRRCAPVAHEVMAIVGSHVGPLGGDETPRSEYEDSYSEPAKKILELYMERDLKLGDVEFVKKLVLQGFQWPLDLVSSSVAKHVQNAELKAYGEPLGDVGFKKLDRILKGEEGGLSGSFATEPEVAE